MLDFCNKVSVPTFCLSRHLLESPTLRAGYIKSDLTLAHRRLLGFSMVSSLHAIPEDSAHNQWIHLGFSVAQVQSMAERPRSHWSMDY